MVCFEIKIWGVILGLFILPFNAYCDTLDYWHVYYNDSVIATFNTSVEDVNIKIKKSDIRESDTISIRYGGDSHHTRCTFVLFVRDDKKNKLGMAETNQYWGKLALSMSALADSGEKNQSLRYDFYYWRRDKDGVPSPMTNVLQVTVE